MNNFISFEGIDGSGKTTQINRLSEWLEGKNIAHTILREPGGTFLSERVRDLLLNVNIDIDPNAETLLFMAARSQLIEEIIKPDLDIGKFVICDRFFDSTLAYQGYGRKLSIDDINSMNNFSTNNLYPQITFLMDIDIHTSFKRRVDLEVDRMESEGKDFLSKVRDGYLEICKENPQRCHIIDATKNEDEIFKDILNKFLEVYKGV